MQRIVIAAAAAAIVALGAAGAKANSLDRPCTAAPESQFLHTGELKLRVEARGYKVLLVELENACAKVYVLDKTGAKVALYVDPANGAIVGAK
jgi:hypothetical protein